MVNKDKCQNLGNKIARHIQYTQLQIIFLIDYLDSVSLAILASSSASLPSSIAVLLLVFSLWIVLVVKILLWN